jgi:hypothetical protein
LLLIGPPHFDFVGDPTTVNPAQFDLYQDRECKINLFTIRGLVGHVHNFWEMLTFKSDYYYYY